MIDVSAEIEEGRVRVAAGRRAETIERGGRAGRVLRDVRLLLIALWLGGAVFFSAVVAPAAFGVLRGAAVPEANHLAGTIVTRTLGAINTSGFIISLLLLGTALLFSGAVRRRTRLAEIISLAVVALTTGLGQWVIAARMLALRGAMKRAIDDVPVDDPLRVEFNSLHGMSVMALSVGIIAAAVALFLIARRGRQRTS